ncbi:phospho-sugar mutase [Vagococcus intermedius]|uniref:Phosphoglucomutase n=1 Tax=Vagococcus intermedius TaxID=2991418 RepID=A0AAF0I6Z6_9ENTE|nr:phospho-sugar mutase [Vagococcus intermedius]WEG73933.1 phospho-sugar mutase [Vagococcus intermedius]WEG76014.1 phospho-sugar mutase [Vagococcus intermedius]
MMWNEIYREWCQVEGLAEEVVKDLAYLKTQPDQLKEAFYAPLEFGTAGIRGRLGAGINRINRYTIRQVSEGLARYIDSFGEGYKAQGVIIAYDSRYYSKEFGLETAKVLARHQIKAYLFDEMRPTPELSFAVRELGCFAGVMITASHNPVAYNGYKIYGPDGGQLPPKQANQLTKFVRQVKNPLEVKVAEHSETSPHQLIEIVGPEIDECYLQKVTSVIMSPQLIAAYGQELKIVYTPLHGVGKKIVTNALARSGFEAVIVEPHQAEGDPAFPTVVSPNPEELTAFELAIALAKKEEAEIVVATDPDADRLGVAVRNGREYQLLSGNQIAALLVHYLLINKKEKGTLHPKETVIKSIVSTNLVNEICKEFDSQVIEVLTGFKFIGEKIAELELKDETAFLFGFEESYGYLIKPFVRDKDAIQAFILLAEVTAYYKSRQETLLQGLEKLSQNYGYFKEETLSLTYEGIAGKEHIQTLMSFFRTSSMKTIGGVEVVGVSDYQSGLKIDRRSGTSSSLDSTHSDVLKYYLVDDSWLAIRPSGTEPKIKFYFGVTGSSEKEASNKLIKLLKAIETLIACVPKSNK